MSNTFGTLSTLSAGDATVSYHSLEALERAGFPRVARLPYSLKVLLENLLRREDGGSVTADDVRALAEWDPAAGATKEIAFMPARVLLQDFTGVPAVVDLAAMRDGVARLGGDPARINPLQPAELVIDHSVQVDHYRGADAFDLNARLEFSRNRERYSFLKWGQQAFDNFRVVPPDTGIVHQVNLEYLARAVCVGANGGGPPMAYPDTLVGTDSHTTMVNGLGVVGWGVGGIEAEAAMLGQAISMLIPEVVGFKLVGRLPEGTTATDLVLTITERLRQHGVVGKFVEFFGPGLAALTLADRATLGNMSPEYGSTVAVCPIDQMTLDYLRLSGRDAGQVALVDAYARAQGMFGAPAEDPVYADVVEFDLGCVEPSIAGPKRPQDRVPLGQAATAFTRALDTLLPGATIRPGGEGGGLDHGAVVVAAITSCTNTSNPSVMIAAGLLAQKAAARGLRPKPWVKTSLAPGSMVVTEYLEAAGLLAPLAELGFNLVGYGCTTCIGNSGPLPEAISEEVRSRDLVVTSVLSGNRNFEGRVQPQVRANYLASPPLVVAYALAGSMTVDLTSAPLGRDRDGNDVFLADLWPSAAEIQAAMTAAVRHRAVHRQVPRRSSTATSAGAGCRRPRASASPGTTRRPTCATRRSSTTSPPSRRRPRTCAARGCSRCSGDSVTTDHISPAGAIPADGPAGKYLVSQGVDPKDFNSFGSRRGNHEVMMRGTFGNIRLRNQLAPGTEGGWTRYQPSDEQMSIYDAAMRYQAAGVPLVVLRGPRVRLGLVARLGGQGHEAARGARGAARELRAHPTAATSCSWGSCRSSSRTARARSTSA